jgi:hypothetical protein
VCAGLVGEAEWQECAEAGGGSGVGKSALRRGSPAARDCRIISLYLYKWDINNKVGCWA